MTEILVVEQVLFNISLKNYKINFTPRYRRSLDFYKHFLNTYFSFKCFIDTTILKLVIFNSVSLHDGHIFHIKPNRTIQ